MSTGSKKVGRPQGSIQTPLSMLKNDMREQIKMNQRLRRILGDAASKLEKLLTRSEDPDLVLKVIDSLSGGITAQSRAVESTAKHVLGAEESGGGGDVDIMKLLKGGTV